MNTNLAQVPRVPDLFVPVLKALETLGGSASNQEIDDRAADLLALTAEVRAYVHKDGPLPKVNYRCAWARSWLKNAGLVENSGRGVWSLTPEGREALTQGDDAALVRQVRQASYALRRGGAPNDESTPPSDDEPTDAEAINAGWRERLLKVLGEMHPGAFERLCQRLLREAGFTRVEVTGKTGDGGIDGTGVLRMNLLSFQVIFQCKRWQGSVGASAVRDFRGAMVGRADKGLILTTGAFTADARREATRDGAPAIDLVDGEALCDLLTGCGRSLRLARVEHALGKAVLPDGGFVRPDGLAARRAAPPHAPAPASSLGRRTRL